MITEQDIYHFESSIEQLIKTCERLTEENRLLRSQQTDNTQERARLLDKNQNVRGKLEEMISRLKNIEQTS